MSYLPMQQNNPSCVCHTSRPMFQAAVMNICPTWAWVAVRWLNFIFREISLCEMSTNKTWI